MRTPGRRIRREYVRREQRVQRNHSQSAEAVPQEGPAANIAI